MNEHEKVKHLEQFKQALLAVSPEYFKVTKLNNDGFQFIERAFSYELYHQIRKSYGVNENWYANCEFRKGLRFLPNSLDNRTFIPDLIIHQQDNIAENILAVEIKTNPHVTGPELVHDLEKLEIYTRPGANCLNYHIGILLIVNSDFRSKFEKMREVNRAQIKKLLMYNRISIYNIAQPITIETSGVEMPLSDECLKIIRFDNLEAPKSLNATIK